MSFSSYTSGVAGGCATSSTFSSGNDGLLFISTTVPEPSTMALVWRVGTSVGNS